MTVRPPRRQVALAAAARFSSSWTYQALLVMVRVMLLGSRGQWDQVVFLDASLRPPPTRTKSRTTNGSGSPSAPPSGPGYTSRLPQITNGHPEGQPARHGPAKRTGCRFATNLLSKGHRLRILRTPPERPADPRRSTQLALS
jgi:hypothetical protein